MRNISSINYGELAAGLAKKYEKDAVYLSIGATEPWLPCYFDIGTLILELEKGGCKDDHWQSLSSHLARSFPYTESYRFSPENLLRMKNYTASFAHSSDLVSWEATRCPNWHGIMPSNFNSTLPQQMKEEARSIFKNSYRIPFPASCKGSDLSKLKERDLENAFVDNIDDAKAQLGPRFSYLDKQYNAAHHYGTYKFDLLFYQHILRCHIIIELKTGAFKANYIEKMEKYLQCAGWELKSRDDQAPIGIFLCRTMDERQVENALKNSNYPIGVATYCF